MPAFGGLRMKKSSWKSTKIWQVKMKSYGLSELWEPEIISDATFKAQLKSSYGNQKPILFYYWTPEWIHAAYDISPLSEPEHTDGCMNLQLDGEDWLEASEAGCKTPDASIYVSYSKSLEQRNPPAAKFLSQMQLDPAVVNDWILKIGRDEMDPQDVAEEWVAANMDTVKGWID
jgi:glycine betaine/proline transport system substrate-binding protein